MDSSNQFCVFHDGDYIRITEPLPADISGTPMLTPDQSLILAVWLALLADPGGQKFERLYNAVKKS
jgi:hypothetical protein